MAATFVFGTGFGMGTLFHKGSAVEFADANISSAVAHTGTYSLINTTNNKGPSMKVYIKDAAGLNLITDEIYWSMWLYVETLNAATGIYIYIDDGNYIKLINPSAVNPKYWDAYVNTTKVASGAVPFYINTWNLIEFHVKIADAGTIETKINGVADISYSGDTKPGASTTLNYTDYNLNPSGTSAGQRIFVDDYTLATGGWIGDVRYDALVPTGDITTQWTASAGSRYACIDEVPASDADYISVASNAQRELSDVTDFTGTNKTIVGVMHWLRGKKDPANSQQIKLVEKIGASENVTAALNLTNAYLYYWTISPTKPGGGAWADADVDGLGVGVDSVI